VTRLDNLAAVQAAARALNDLDADQERPIDPFDAIDKLGLELQFHPLRDLLGAILPGERPGILINSARPASVQRYTAAHEIGHWYLDQDELAIDTEEDVEGMPRRQRERRAQIFASHFLMPLGLLHATAARHGVYKGSSITPVQVYQMARDMHVSYRAVAFQLVNSRFIGTSARDAMLLVQPAELKTALTHGRRPHNTRGDVWTTEADTYAAPLEVFVGDELVLGLPERPSTGYRWFESGSRSRPQAIRHAPAGFTDGGAFTAVTEPKGNVVALRPEDAVGPILAKVADELDLSQPTPELPVRIGAPTTRRMAFHATRPGTSVLNLEYGRPFSVADPLDRVQVTTRVRGLPKLEERQRRLRQFALEEQMLGEGPSI
jgi:Zn-dependent peptidase ImmA (M78 family)/predicted secreted protein